MISLCQLVQDGVWVTGSSVLSAGDLRGAGVVPEAIGSRVALVLRDPVNFVRALCALDGQVEAMLLLSGGLGAETASELVRRAGCDLLVTDREDLLPLSQARPLADLLAPVRLENVVETSWLMTTSGTTGLPKIAPHSLASLTRSVARFPGVERAIWGLLYDPARFAGLQVVLQALAGGSRLVMVDSQLALGEQVATLARAGVTHLSATPTLWRRLLMVPGHKTLLLRQITLGGEIVDQPILSALASAYPEARISHIYASTEAGVGFSVKDRLAGFPASYLDSAPGGVSLKVVDGILWLRPPEPAREPSGVEADEDGFVRSGDLVEVVDGRARFLGRDSGLINIGGIKVHPERVEAVLATVPGVVLAKVTGKPNPVTGALVVAEAQLAPGADPAALRTAILQACRMQLEREAVPAILRFVDGFETNAAGKLARTGR